MLRSRFMIAALFLVLTACAGGFGLGNGDLESPEVTLSDIQFRGAGLLEQQLGLVLRLRNPNDTDLALRGLKVKLNVDGEPFVGGASIRGQVRPNALRVKVPRSRAHHSTNR